MTTSLRVLHVIDSLGPGGAERSLVELAAELRRRGHQPVVVSLHQAAETLEPDLVDAGVPVIRIHVARTAGRVRVLRRLLAEYRPDVLHTTLFESDVTGRLAAIGSQVGVLTSLVNTSYEPVRLLDSRVHPLRLRAAQLLDATTAAMRGDRFHAISCVVADSAINRLHIPSQSVVVIPRGRRRERLGEPSPARRQRVRNALGVRDDQFVVLHIGREDFQKGHVDLIRAFRDVRRQDARFVLLLAGRRGNVSEALDQDLHRNHQSIIRLGYRSDVGDLLTSADLFVFPSIYEGLGGAVIEAMAMELPIIASDLPVLRETLGPEGTFVEVQNPAALATAMLAAPGELDRIRDVGRRHRRRFEARFDFDTVVDQMIEAFASTARMRSRS